MAAGVIPDAHLGALHNAIQVEQTLKDTDVARAAAIAADASE